jgi:hypothetical protein
MHFSIPNQNIQIHIGPFQVIFSLQYVLDLNSENFMKGLENKINNYVCYPNSSLCFVGFGLNSNFVNFKIIIIDPELFLY